MNSFWLQAVVGLLLIQGLLLIGVSLRRAPGEPDWYLPVQALWGALNISAALYLMLR